MGLGLQMQVPVLMNTDRAFDIVGTHYRVFPIEPGPPLGYDLSVFVPQEDGRFDTFATLVRLLTKYAELGTVIVVNHGRSDNADRPIGLALPLTSGGPTWDLDENALRVLSRLVGREMSDEDYVKAVAAAVTDFGLRPLNAGALKAVDAALKELRKAKLRRVEFRACNIGGSDSLMQLLARVLGVQTVVAPDVHMFYVRCAAAIPASLAQEPRAWMSAHPNARLFAPASGGATVGIQIIGKGPRRDTATLATTAVVMPWA